MRLALVTSIAIGLLTVPAHAEENRRGDATWKKAFWGGVAATVGMTAGAFISTNRVHDREDDKEQLLREIRDSDPNSDILGANNVCDAADASSSQLANELSSVCSSGQRWATTANVFYLGTLAAVAFSGYSFYRGYLRRNATESKIQVTPTAGPNGAGVTLRLGF